MKAYAIATDVRRAVRRTRREPDRTRRRMAISSLVIIEFPSRAAAEGWYRSAEYQKVISLRLNSSVGNLIIVDGSA